MQSENNELDRIIHNALASDDELGIPNGLSERTILKLEKRMLLKELTLELSLKIGLVLGSLCLLVGVFAWLNGSGVIIRSYTYFVNNWQLITSLLLLVFITILIDQIVLRFYNAIKNSNKHVSLN
jgi:hypothetical protein